MDAAPYVRPEVRRFLDDLAATPGPKLSELGPAGAREMMRQMNEMFDLPAGELAVNRALEAPAPGGGTLALRLFDARAERPPGPLLLFLHGGGFVMGEVAGYLGGCAEIARQLDMPVLAVDYRLAPEHPWPAPPDDCEAVARWAAASPAALGREVTGLVIAGDSAGGALAIVTTLALRDAPAAVPVLAQWLMYPVTDLSTRRPSHEIFGSGYMLETGELEWFYGLYGAERSHWRASPLLADQTGMPPTLIATCGLDPLRDEGRAYAAATAQAGVPTTFLEARGMIHGFLSFRGALPSARGDVEACTRALKALLETTALRPDPPPRGSI
jgi:acetyl esterase